MLTLIVERKEGAELGDEFNIDVDDAMEDRPERGGGSRGRGGKTKVSPQPSSLTLQSTTAMKEGS